MASKAEELVDKLRGIAENYQQVTNNPPMYNLGDAVTIMRDGFEYVALIEAIDEDEYTIRVQAIAGNEFEATDKVYVVNAEDLVMYSAPKSFAIGDVVEWKSQAGITLVTMRLNPVLWPTEPGSCRRLRSMKFQLHRFLWTRVQRLCLPEVNVLLIKQCKLNGRPRLLMRHKAIKERKTLTRTKCLPMHLPS
jgi:hypothetical protein